MNIVKEFEYDLWTTEDEHGKHYWSRIKATGEVAEISHELMKFMRSEEKKMWREIVDTSAHGGPDLSYDHVPTDDETSIWLMDPSTSEESILFNLYLKEFRLLLTPIQLSVLDDCLLAGLSIREYAKLNNRNHKSIQETVDAIRKKYKNYFL